MSSTSPSSIESGPSSAAASDSAQSPPPAESGDTSRRVVVAGGGVMGWSVAYHLALRGYAPLVVERCETACAASGKAGGFLAQAWCDSSPLRELTRTSFALHQEFASKAKFDGAKRYEFRHVTTLHVDSFTDDDQAARGRPRGAADVPAWIDASRATVQEIGTPETTVQLTPRLFTLMLQEEAEKLGATSLRAVVDGIECEDVAGNAKAAKPTRRICGVRVTRPGPEEAPEPEILPCDLFVMCLGPWSGIAAAWGLDVPPMVGEKAHSLLMRPDAELAAADASGAREPITAHCSFLHIRCGFDGKVRHPEVYPRPNGDVYCCGMTSSTTLPADPADIHPDPVAIERLKKQADALSSRLAAADVEHSQACFLPASPDGFPLIGPVAGAENAFVATGHYCWGVLNSTGTGAALAELIDTGECALLDLDRYDPRRFEGRVERL